MGLEVGRKARAVRSFGGRGLLHFITLFVHIFACLATFLFSKRSLPTSLAFSLLTVLWCWKLFPHTRQTMLKIVFKHNPFKCSLLDSVARLSAKKRAKEVYTLVYGWQASMRFKRKWWESKLNVCVSNYKRAKAAYFSRLISNNKHNPRILFDTVAKLKTVGCSPFMAHDCYYFLQKNTK